MVYRAHPARKAAREKLEAERAERRATRLARNSQKPATVKPKITPAAPTSLREEFERLRAEALAIIEEGPQLTRRERELRKRYSKRLMAYEFDPRDIGAHHVMRFYLRWYYHKKATEKFRQWEKERKHETETKRQPRKTVAPNKATRARNRP